MSKKSQICNAIILLSSLSIFSMKKPVKTNLTQQSNTLQKMCADEIFEHAINQVETYNKQDVYQALDRIGKLSAHLRTDIYTRILTNLNIRNIENMFNQIIPVIKTIDYRHDYKSFPQHMYTAEFSSTDETVVIGFSYIDAYNIKRHTADIWNITNSKPYLQNHFSDYRINKTQNMALSPDGKIGIEITQYPSISIVWDLKTHESLYDLPSYLTSVTFSPDGKFILASLSDNTAKIFDASNGNSLYTLVEHKNTIKSAQFNWNGTKIITASTDGTVKIWDIRNFLEAYNKKSQNLSYADMKKIFTEQFILQENNKQKNVQN